MNCFKLLLEESSKDFVPDGQDTNTIEPYPDSTSIVSISDPIKEGANRGWKAMKTAVARKALELKVVKAFTPIIPADGWTENFDATSSRKYWKNVTTNTTTWDDPYVAKIQRNDYPLTMSNVKTLILLLDNDDNSVSVLRMELTPTCIIFTTFDDVSIMDVSFTSMNSIHKDSCCNVSLVSVDKATGNFNVVKLLCISSDHATFIIRAMTSRIKQDISVEQEECTMSGILNLNQFLHAFISSPIEALERTHAWIVDTVDTSIASLPSLPQYVFMDHHQDLRTFLPMKLILNTATSSSFSSNDHWQSRWLKYNPTAKVITVHNTGPSGPSGVAISTERCTVALVSIYTHANIYIYIYDIYVFHRDCKLYIRFN